MQPNEYRDELRSFLNSDSGSLVCTIPAGSGICHISNVDVNRWSPGFVSTNAGRWTEAGRPSKYFADDFSVCLAELGYSPNPPAPDTIFELWQTTSSSPAINLGNLPEYLRRPLYEDRGPPPLKWQKSHILLNELAATPAYAAIGCIYAPSASGELVGIGGMCFVANPFEHPIERIDKYTYSEWRSVRD